MPIRKYREMAGLTQTAAAKRLYISIDSVRRYESGIREPRSSDLKRMAELYGCTMEELLKAEEK